MHSNLTAHFQCLSDFQAAAREQLPHDVYEYVDAGAGDEITKRDNGEAFNRIKLRPRVLRDVSKINTSISLFGQKMPHPIVLAPLHISDCCMLRAKWLLPGVAAPQAQSLFLAHRPQPRSKTALQQAKPRSGFCCTGKATAASTENSFPRWTPRVRRRSASQSIPQHQATDGDRSRPGSRFQIAL